MSPNEMRSYQRRCDDEKAKILRIAERQGYFRVSWRYRDDFKRRMCASLVKDGRLRSESSGRGMDVYMPTGRIRTLKEAAQ